MTLKLKLIIGSTRPGRKGPAVAAWVAEAAKAHGGYDVETVDLAEVALPFFDEPNHPSKHHYHNDHTKRWSAIVGEADAVVFVTPEYDFFIPATIVNAVQMLFHEWKYKPAGVVSYGGVSGGLRATQELRQLVGNLGMAAIPQSVPVPFFTQFLNDDGVLEPNGKMDEGVHHMLRELGRWARALKPMREEAERERLAAAA